MTKEVAGYEVRSFLEELLAVSKSLTNVLLQLVLQRIEAGLGDRG